MTYRPQESDGFNVRELIKDAGSNPAPSAEGNVDNNIVRLFHNLWRVIQGMSTSMPSLPAQVSSGEITAGTETGTRLWSPADVKSAVEQHETAAEATITEQTGASYTFVLADANTIVERNNAGANDTLIPLNATVAFPIGTTIDIPQTGAGLGTVKGVSGVTINGATEAGGDESAVTSQGQWKAISIYKRAADTWVAIGGA